MSAAKKVEVRLRPHRRVLVDDALADAGSVVKVSPADAETLIAEGFAETPGAAAAHEAAAEAVETAERDERYAEGLRAVAQRDGGDSDREYAAKAAEKALKSRAEADRLLAAAEAEANPAALEAAEAERAAEESEHARREAVETAQEARGRASEVEADQEAVEAERERNALSHHDPPGD